MGKNYTSNYKKAIQLLLLFFLFLGNQLFSQTIVNTITTTGAGSFTVPCGVTSLTIEAWGGGGAGGGANVNPAGGSGGGGGGYCSATVAVIPGTVIPYTVGARGAGGAGNGANGSATTILTLTANGGSGGSQNGGGIGLGGSAIGGTINIPGGNGGLGTITLGAAGGTCNALAGGASRNTAGNGIAATNPGSGGGGGLRLTATNRNGGNGADGQIRITYTDGVAPYCKPDYAGAANVVPITNVTFAGINNTTSNTAFVAPEYDQFCASIGTVTRGDLYNDITIKGNTVGNNTFFAKVYVDWNQDGTFDTTTEAYNIGSLTNSTGVDALFIAGNISVPATALLGNTRMRVMYRFGGYPNDPCQTGTGNGQTEDYTLNVVAPSACVAPITQPTGLVLTPVGQSINGTFTHAAPRPDQYLVVISTSAVAPPPPVNGTTYNIGDTLSAGYTVVDIDNNNTFNAGALNLSTTYYFYIYSFNAACTGGPLYRTVAPLTGNATTPAVPATYCTPVTTSAPTNRLYVSKVEFVGTLQDTSNSSTTGASPGYQDFTGLATKSIQAQGGPINMKLTSAPRGFWKVWVDWNKDGDFADAGEEVYNPTGFMFISTTFGFVVPTSTPPGDYRMRIRVQNTYRNSNGAETLVDFNSCNSFDPITISGIGYQTYGEAEDYLFTVIPKCDNKVTSITNPAICGTGSATLSAVGTGPNIKWYDSLTGGTLLATTASGANFTTPVIATTTTYYITSSSASCETLTRIPVVAEVKPVPSLIIANPNPTICGENSIIQLDATGNNEVAYLINEDFEAGTLGVFTNVNSDGTTAAQKAKTAWKNKTSIYIPTGNRWFPAISSGFGTNKFALTSMDDFTSVPLPTVPMENSLTLTTSVSPVATSFANLTLTFKIFYSRYYADGVNPTTENCNVEVSTNGGTTWTTLPGGTLTADQGYGSSFVTLSYNLNAYTGSNNLKIRIRVLGDGSGSGTAGDGVAIDDVKLFGDRPLTPFFALGGGVDSFIDAAATIPYTGDQRNTIWIKPTLTQLEQTAFTINVNANLNNGCTTGGTINVTNNTRVWKGTINSDWNTSGNWGSSAIPTASSCVIIPSGTSSQIMNAPDALAKNVTIKAPTGSLELQSNRNLTVFDWINVEAGGTFNIRNNGNLVQVNNTVNTGVINMERTTNIRKLDYVYWSSPVGNFNSTAISPATSASFIFKWNPTIVANLNGWGNWTGGVETMVLGKGYIVRGPNTYTSVLQNYTATFNGIPNNGTITTPISRGTYNGANYVSGSGSTTLATKDDDNWNLLGNPYPSAINPTSFLAANTNLAGFVKIWTHGTLPSGAISDPYYADFASNYTAGDYITYNGSGSTAGPGVNNIAAGQGFFTLMNHTSAATSETVTFTNAMRRDGSGNPYSNNQFYKNANNQEHSNDADKNRIWMDLVSPSNKNIRTLLGYISDATNDADRLFDAKADEKMSFNFYSLLNEEPQTIQGRQLPFDSNDTVDFGYKTDENGLHTIAIFATDGLFEKNNIYLEDKELHIIHNLSKAPYTFQGNSGTNNTRFRVRFNKGPKTEIANTNETRIYATNSININSSSKKINSVSIYDMLGKTLFENDYVSQNDYVINEVKKSNSILIVKIILEDGEIVTEKIKY